jgi:hypothetical protein
MDPNGGLLQRLYTSLDRHAAAEMTDAYAVTATFRDIAFDLQGRPQIGAMWDMICSTAPRTR